MTLEQLRQQVLLLPVQDRAALIRDLIDSLEPDESSEPISQSWLDEIAARSDALHRGEMECEDWRTSLGRVRERLAGKAT
ncbi:MAG: addiction module protein [Planctomycetaceae bacterium]